MLAKVLAWSWWPLGVEVVLGAAGNRLGVYTTLFQPILSIFYMPSPVLGHGDQAMKADRIPFSLGAYSLGILETTHRTASKLWRRACVVGTT